MANVPNWWMRGDWFDVCSCDIACPCEFAQPPTNNHCEGVMAYHIREGAYGHVRMSGSMISVSSPFYGLMVTSGPRQRLHTASSLTSVQTSLNAKPYRPCLPVRREASWPKWRD